MGSGSADSPAILHIAYYQELRRVIEASQPGERVALVNLQLMRLDEPVILRCGSSRDAGSEAGARDAPN